MQPPPRVVTFVVDEPRGALPAVDVESPWWMESGPLVEAARSAFGVEVTVLRLLRGERFPGGPVTYLVEAPDIAPGLLEPWPADLGDDPLRASYARPGGVAALVSWAGDALGSQGLPPCERVEQVRTWNLSCLLRLHLADGSTLWLKAVPSFFEHEPDVMQALSGVDPTLVPHLVAVRPGATLMRQVGERDGYDVGPDRHFDAVRRFVAAREMLDLDKLSTVPHFGPVEMAAELTAIGERHGTELDAHELVALSVLVDELPDRWAAANVAPTLTHGDLHGGNLRLADVGSDTIIDWGDASITHPLFDLAVLDGYTPHWERSATDRWLELLGVDHAGWEALRPLAAVRLAVVYQRFCDGIEASERIYHREDVVPALRTGLQHFHG